MISETAVELYANCADLVCRVRRGDESGAEDLYHTVTGNARARLRRNVDPHLVEDGLHDIVVTVLEAIQVGALREPERLMGFVRTVTQRQVAAHIRSNMARRRRLTPLNLMELACSSDHSPEAAFVQRERTDSLRRVLRRLRARDREILIRFYYHEQDANQICEEMNLTTTQFRLFKSRAIARCSDFARAARKEAESEGQIAPALDELKVA